MEDELQKIRDGILALMDKELIPSPGTDELKVFYITVILPRLQRARQRAKPAKMPVSLVRKPPRSQRKTWMALSSVFQSKVLQNPDDVAGGMHVGKNDLDDVSVVAQRQIPIDQTVQKTVETPQLQCMDRVIDGKVVQVENVPQSHVAEKTVEIPQLDVFEKIVETPESRRAMAHRIESNSGRWSRSFTPVLPVVEELPEVSKALSEQGSTEFYGLDHCKPCYFSR